MGDAERAVMRTFSMGRESGDRSARLMAAAEELVPVLAERAGETERLGRLPDETVADFHARGLFRILQPRAVGGAELDYVALVDFGEIIARGCASSAWVLTNLASHHWLLAMWPKVAQDRIWNEDPDALVASSFVFPAGRAEKVEGGYRVSGRWPFSSGVDPSTWNMLAGVVALDPTWEQHEYRVFILHRSDYEIVENWDVMGLKGTGSKDVVAENVFVPEEMTLAVDDMKGGETPGSPVHPNPLYKIPVFALFPYVLSGVALGNARAMVDDYVAINRSRVSRYNRTRLADVQSTQVRIGEAAARVDAARRVMRQICEEAMADAAAGRVPDLAEKTRFRRDGAFATRLCTEAVDLLYEASGAGALYSENPGQRRFRDAHAIAAHIAFSFDMAGATYGRVMLGLEPDNPTL